MSNKDRYFYDMKAENLVLKNKRDAYIYFFYSNFATWSQVFCLYIRKLTITDDEQND